MTSTPLTDLPVAGSATSSVGERVSAATATLAPIDRALPGWCVDLVRDGLASEQLRAGSAGVAVDTACYRVALSAANHGWDRWEYEAEILNPDSNLGRQLGRKVREGGRTVARPRAHVMADLAKAWDKATILVSEKPRFTPEERRGIALSALNAAADPEADLTDTDRKVLAYAAEEGVRRSVTTPYLPWREVVAGTGLGQRATQNALKRLSDRGVLVCVDPGRRGARGAVGKQASKSAIYRLPDRDAIAHYLYRETRSMGPPAQIYGTPSPEPVGTPAQIYGTPSAEPQSSKQKEQAGMVTLTLSAPEAEAIADFLRLLRVGPGADVPDAQATKDDRSPLSLVPPLREIS